MKGTSIVVTLLLGLVLAVLPLGFPVRADVPTALAYSVSPQVFALGQTSTTAVCLAQQNNPPGNFDPGDVANIVFDPSLGSLTGVDNPVTVKSATLAPGDFTAAQAGGNPNKIRITYTAGASKSFGFGDSVCATVHFTASASPAAALVRFSDKFTGLSGTLPSVTISVLDPSLVLHGGSPASGATDLAGGQLVIGGGPGNGLGGGGNVNVQTAGANDITGTTGNLLVDREIFVAKAKPLTLSSPGFTSLMSIHLVGTHTAGGRIFYTVRATDGGSQIATEEGIIQYLATANSITCTVQSTDKLHLGTVNSGCTPGFFNPGSQPGVSIFDNVSFSTPAPIVVHEVYFRIVNDSGSSIRLEP